MSASVAILQALACCGLGAMALRLAGVLASLPPIERWGWSFAAGLGLLGWLNFWLAASGWLGTMPLAAPLVAGAFGCLLLPMPTGGLPVGWEWALALVLAAALGFDLAEALAPPADADSLAYHFARPKEILASGRLEPVARAVDGATPMLMQMTYLSALALGGERALTLWAGLSGWLALLPLFGVTRRWLPDGWALAVVAVVATVPAWIYGAGSGQVEARLAPLVLTALMAIAPAIKTGSLRWAVAAGLLAGWFAGAKFFGLPFAALCGGALLLRGHWRAGLAFAAAAALAGGQWYVWHWVRLGDPLFPLLWRWFGATAWDQVHAETLAALYYRAETAVPANPLWLLAYPWVASVAPFPIWEASRTGLGPYGLVVAPFALAGLWQRRRALLGHPLTPVAALALAFYALWFLSGTSQRIRHLLPLFPVLVLGLTVAAHRWATASCNLRPLAAGLAAVLLIQLAGHGIFAAGYLKGLATGEGRQDFLLRNVINYAPVPWLNRHLGPHDRLLLGERQLIYHLDVPVYFGHEYFQARLNLLPGAEDDIDRRLAELRALGITHVLAEPAVEGGITRLVRRLQAMGCARPVADIAGRLFQSRTLGLGDGETRLQVLEIAPACRK